MKFNERAILAFSITGISVLGVIALSWVIIATTDEAGTQRAQNVLNTVLPLLGTWVGTVLAYYFSRENFEAATSSTEKLLRLTQEERMKSVFIKDVMNKNIIKIIDQTERVEKVLENLKSNKIKRLPILTKDNVFVSLFYTEDLIDYLLGLEKDVRSTKTIKDMVDTKDYDKKPAFVTIEGTLADAKQKLEDVPDCKVVFVTQNGDQKEPIVGMLTNTDIVRYSHV